MQSRTRAKVKKRNGASNEHTYPDTDKGKVPTYTAAGICMENSRIWKSQYPSNYDVLVLLVCIIGPNFKTIIRYSLFSDYDLLER